MDSDALKDRVLEALYHVPGILCKQFFHDYMLYDGNHLVGIISGGQLYLRTNKFTRRQYVDKGMQKYHERDRAMGRFYQVPYEIVNDGRMLAAWAREAATVKDSSPTLTGRENEW